MSEMRQPSPETTVTPMTQADLDEMRMGTNGNPTYEQQFGQTSQPLGQNFAPGVPTIAELELAAAKAYQAAIDPNAAAAQQLGAQFPTDLAAMQAEIADLKKKYGDSENEKGDYRRQYQQLLEAFNGAVTQLEAVQQQPQPQAWQNPAPQQFQPQAFQPQFDPFGGIGDEDVMQGKQLKEAVASAMALHNQYLSRQIEAQAQRQAAIERQLLAQAETAQGITAVDKFRVLGQNPWIRNLPPAQQMQAIAALRGPQPTPSNGNGNGSHQQTVPAETQDRIIRKVTYVEGGKPEVPDTSQAALEAAQQRDYALAMSKPADTGERAAALRSMARKYGYAFGQAPSDIAR